MKRLTVEPLEQAGSRYTRNVYVTDEGVMIEITIPSDVRVMDVREITGDEAEREIQREQARRAERS